MSERAAHRLEWAFVIMLSTVVLVYATLPYIWAARAQSKQYRPDLVYTHVLPTYADDATTYWSWMRQARDGRFLLTDLHTPDEHPRNYINILFWSLGTVSRATGVAVPYVYQAARFLLGAALLGLLYLLARRMFARPGERMACFFMLVLAGGWEGAAGFMERNFGWGHLSSPAWWTPEMSTFYSLMIFPHFIAGFICMIGVALLMIRAWWTPAGPADGFIGPPRAVGASVGAGLVLSVLTFFHPYDTVNIMGLVWAGPAALGLLDRRWPWREWRQSAIATIVWLPSFLYNLYIFRNNPAMRAWDLQNLMYTPEAYRLAIALGVGGFLSLVALIGFRSLRREHTVIAAWLVSTLIIIHLPVRFQRRAIGGIQFPLAVLATAAIACVLLPWVARRLRLRHGISRSLGWGTLAVTMFIAPLQVATPYYLQDIEWSTLRRLKYPAWLEIEPWRALDALEKLGPPESTVLTSYEIGNYIPPLTGHRCVVGHYALTVDARQKEADVARFFAAGAEDDPWRLEFLRRWQVDYVMVTSFERKLGDFDPGTRPWLEEIFASGSDPDRRAVIYAVRLEAAAARSPSSIPSP
jgi:hypothetical protein